LISNGAKFHPIISTVKFHTQFEKKTIVPNRSTYVSISNIYRVYRETLATAHRKVDGIEMNIKVPYRLVIFAIIIEILIFEIILMRARLEKRSSRSRYSPAQFIKR